MSQVKITLTIDIPDGVVPSVDYADVPAEPEYIAAALTALPQYDADVRVTPVAQGAPGCPTHGAMTRFPAGVNKAGKPYNASWRCTAKDCPTKPVWDRDAA